MKDKCILITGSSQGIGLSITQRLLQLGAKVIGIARDHDSIKIENENYIKYTSDISDLIKLGNLYDSNNKKKYNINIKKLSKLKEPLTNLDNMIGMKKVKKTVIDQILYYLQNFSTNV